MSPINPGLPRGIGLLLVLLLVVPATFADDPANPFEPPEVRITIPGGRTSQASISAPISSRTTDARIVISGGVREQSRIKIPGGLPEAEPGPAYVELLLEWLRAQARVRPPIG